MKTMNRLVFALCAAALLALRVASAAPTDLAGADLVVPSLAELNAEGYANSSETCATLTFAFADVCTVPSLSGNLRLVLDGGVTATFAAAQGYTGGTLVSNATLVVTSACEVMGVGAASGALTLAGGTIRCAKRANGGRYLFNRAFVVAPGTSGMIVNCGDPVSLYIEFVDYADATLVAACDGAYGYYWLYRGEKNHTWQALETCKGGTFVVARNVALDLSSGDTFGNGSHNYDITLCIRDGGSVAVGGNHSPLTPKVILEGGAKVYSAEQSRANASARAVDAILDSNKWLCTDLCHWVKVVPGVSTNTAFLNMPNVHLAPLTRDCFFDVAEGAVFEVDGQLWPAHGQAGRSLRKTGKGTLRLKRPLAIGGPLYVDEGAVELAPHVMLGDVSDVRVSDGAKLVLGDGSLWNKGPVPPRAGGFLSTAEVWFDATTVRAEEGAHVSGIRNLGTAGGTFEKFTTNGRPASQSPLPVAPTFTTNGINGRASLHFAGGSRENASWNSDDVPEALLLKSYTNVTDRLTYYVVYKWDGWEDDNNRYYKWHGPISFSRAKYFAGEDNNTPGACDIQYGVTFKSANFIYGPDAGVTPGFDGAPSHENALLARSVRSGSTATAGTWWSDAYPSYRTGTCKVSVSHDIQRMSLGGRLSYGDMANSTRMLKGWIGEVIVFSRDLTEAEDAFVTSYLKRKWFDSSVAAVDDPAPAVHSVKVGVGDDGIGTLGMSGNSDNTVPDPAFERLDATGPGTLRLVGTAQDYGDVTVSAGALRLNGEAAASSEATLWFDPSDADTVETNAEGRIVSVRNKGNLCGAFVQAKGRWGTPCPLPTLTTLNGRAAVKFDSNSGLGISCDSVANQNGRRQMVVYGVLRRDGYVFEGGKGKWGGPFSFYQSTAAATRDDYQQDYGLHYQELAADAVDLCYAKGGFKITYPIADGTPYVFSFYAVDHDLAVGFETVRTEDPSTMSNVVWKSDLGGTAPSNLKIPYDYLLLGGRLYGECRAQWHSTDHSANRMWNGTVAEFVVFDRQPSNARLNELADYLRKKWFDVGTGSATPPAWLTGVAASAPKAGVTVKGGATLETEGAAVTLPSLTLEDGAAVARLDAVTDADAFALFDVTGHLSLVGSQTLLNAAFPKGKQVKLIDAATISGAAAWTFAGAKSKTDPIVESRSDGLWYVSDFFMIMVK